MIKITTSGNGWKDWQKGASPSPAAKIKLAIQVATQRTAVECKKLFKANIESGGSMVGAAFPRNAPLTIKKKGFDKPLIWKGDMMNAFREYKKGAYAYDMGWGNSNEREKAMFSEVGGLANIDN